MSSDPGAPPPWFFGRALQALVAIVRAIIEGKTPTRGHILFLAVALITLVALVGTILLFFLGQPIYLFATIGTFVLGLLALFLVMPAGGAVEPGGGGADGQDVGGEPASEGGAEAARRSDEVAVGEYRQWMNQLAVRCGHIYEHLKTDDRPDVLEERFVLTVTPEWGLKAVSTVRLRAVAPFLVLLRRLTGEPAVRSFWELDLRVTATRGTHQPQPVVVLPASGTGSSIAVLLFFPPGLPAGAELEYRMEWRWPGQWTPLRDDRSDTWSVLARTRNPIGLVRLEFRLPPDHPVTLVNHSAVAGEQVVPDPPRDGDGYWVYACEFRQVEHEQQLVIELRR